MASRMVGRANVAPPGVVCWIYQFDDGSLQAEAPGLGHNWHDAGDGHAGKFKSLSKSDLGNMEWLEFDESIRSIVEKYGSRLFSG